MTEIKKQSLEVMAKTLRETADALWEKGYKEEASRLHDDARILEKEAKNGKENGSGKESRSR